MSARKKWSTTTLPTIGRVRHPSKTETYGYIRALVTSFAAGNLRTDLVSVKVWVDEGSGWQLYETLRLADLPDPSAVGGERSDNPKASDLGGGSCRT